MPTRKEGECSDEQISANIAKLIKEGKPREQAIAIAFEGCPQQRTEYKQALRRVTIVDEVQGVIRGYGIIWGSAEHRDSYQTWFDKEQPPELGLDFLPKMLMYEHGFDGGIKKDIIGRVVRIWFDEVGVAFEAILDKTHAAFTRFISEIRSGKLATSTATAEHLAEFDSDGRFVNWPILEITLTANPAEELMPAVQLMRSNLTHGASGQSQGEMTAYERIRRNTREGHSIMNPQEIIAALIALGEGATIEQIIDVLISGGLSKEDFDATLSQLEMPDKARQEDGDSPPAPEGAGEGDTPATEEVVSLVDQLIPALTVVLEEKQAVEAVAQLETTLSKNKKLAKDGAKMAVQLATYRSQQRQEQAMPNTPSQPRHGGGGVTLGRDLESYKYDHLTAQEMIYGHMLLHASKKPISDGYIRHMADKAITRIELGASAFGDVGTFRSMRSALRGATRADELVYTTNTGFGLEWIPDMWESQIWETIFQTEIMTALQRDMMIVQAGGRAGSTVSIALESSDPTWHSATENKSVGDDLNAGNLVTPTQIGTAKVDVTPGKAMMVVIVSTEMIEDSIIDLLPQLTKQVNRSAERTLESIMLNGDTDTTASTNINLIDGTPASGTDAPFYLVSDGMLKYALVTGSSTSTSGGVLTSDDFLDARGLLPNELQPDPSRMIFVSDNSTMLKSLRLTDWKDISVSLNPTQESGVITKAWGTQYIQSAQMAKANSAGKISATSGNNTLGRLLLVVPEYWAMVWKRQMKFTTTELPKQDVTEVVASLRVAFKARSAGAATVIYNLTV